MQQQQQTEDAQGKLSTPGQNSMNNQPLATPPRPRTPPPKQEAFEQFKKERGERLHQILMENKGTLTCTGFFYLLCSALFSFSLRCFKHLNSYLFVGKKRVAKHVHKEPLQVIK